MADQNTPDPKIQAIENDIQTIADNAAAVVQVVSKVNTWSAICGFFTALPGIILLIQQIMAWLQRVSPNDPQAMVVKLGQAFENLNNSQTQGDKDAAAQQISTDISKLPKS